MNHNTLLPVCACSLLTCVATLLQAAAAEDSQATGLGMELSPTMEESAEDSSATQESSAQVSDHAQPASSSDNLNPSLAVSLTSGGR